MGGEAKARSLKSGLKAFSYFFEVGLIFLADVTHLGWSELV
jgi:hypothetical protein